MINDFAFIHNFGIFYEIFMSWRTKVPDEAAYLFHYQTRLLYQRVTRALLSQASMGDCDTSDSGPAAVGFHCESCCCLPTFSYRDSVQQGRIRKRTPLYI